MKYLQFLLAFATLTLLIACGKGTTTPTAPLPTEVGVVRAQAGAAPLTRDLVGRLSATRIADVRARVPGVLLARRYREGAEVKRDQILFEIDPAQLKAAVTAAVATLAQAQASAANAHVLAERTRELAPKGWVSRSELDNAQAAERSSVAQVQQAEANLAAARINLGYATVRAPISGRASQQQVTEGALVGQSEATLLTTVEQIDPLYVNFDQPANETFGKDQQAVQLQVILPDGTPYAHSGALDFSAFNVDPDTGALALRGSVPNPDKQLLPGMFVTVRVTAGQTDRAFKVPQTALQRDGTGPYVFTVGSDSKVVQTYVKTQTMIGGDWIVTDGLSGGESIIVSGIQKVRPGTTVKIAPAG